MKAPASLMRIEGDNVIVLRPTRRSGVARHLRARMPDESLSAHWSAALREAHDGDPAGAVLVALDSPRCRYRLLFDVAEECDEGTVNAMLCGDPSEFFTGQSVDMVPGGVTLAPDGWYGAVVARDAMEALEAAFAAAGARLHGVVPLATVDDRLATAALLRTVLRDRALAGLVDPAREARVTRAASRRRLFLMAFALTAGLAGAFGPAVTWLLAARHQRAVAASLAEQAATTNPGVGAKDAALREDVVALEAGRTSMTALMSRFALATTDGAVLSAVDIDSAAVRLTVLSPSGSDAVAQLARLEGLGEARLRGPITQMRIGERMVERASIEFLRAQAPRTSRAAAGTP